MISKKLSLIVSSKKASFLYPSFGLFAGVLLFHFLKWLFALMVMGHVSNAGSKPQWLEILSRCNFTALLTPLLAGELMARASNCCLIGLLFLWASGCTIIHKSSGQHLRMLLGCAAGLIVLAQLICAITLTTVSNQV